jgi:hypothetical protein
MNIIFICIFCHLYQGSLSIKLNARPALKILKQQILIKEA